MNNVTLIGRICNDIEMKTTTNGVEVISFCLAVDRKFKNANGEKQTDFINIVAW
ncbi:MAG: single-stranded DNA-binding protein, partial [Clostridiales bacterium]|nr:single-stranded DNA-binding protein [Clostridiales bacterium]